MDISKAADKLIAKTAQQIATDEAVLGIKRTDHIAADQSGVDERAKLLARLDHAMDIVGDVSSGKRNWTMSVPARPDSDPDLIISAALRDAKAALSSNAAQSAGQEPVGYLIRYKSTDPKRVFPWVYSSDPVSDDGAECAAIYTHPSSAAQVEEIRNAALEEAAKEFDDRDSGTGGWYDPHEPAEIIRALKTAAPSKGEEIMETTEDLKKAYELLFAEISVLRKQNEKLLEYLTSAVENPEDSAYWLGSAKRFVDSLSAEGEKQNG